MKQTKQSQKLRHNRKHAFNSTNAKVTVSINRSKARKLQQDGSEADNLGLTNHPALSLL